MWWNLMMEFYDSWTMNVKQWEISRLLRISGDKFQLKFWAF